MTGLEELKNLRDIITSSLDDIINFCERREISFPSLFSPADPNVEFSPTGLRNAPELADAFSLGISAAAQIVATLQSPAITALSSSLRHILPACVSVVERTNVPEILREAGPRGMHAKEIAAKISIDPKRLARILRYLSTNYVFKEIAPDVFAHNLVSSCLDTGKSFEETRKDPAAKFDNTVGIQAFSSLSAEDTFRAAVNLLPNITDPKTAFSDEENASPMQRAFNSNVSYWLMIEQPGEENRRRFRRLNAAMEGSAKTQPPKAILQLFNWNSVPQGGLLVDVGAGLGNVSIEVAKVRPDMQFVVEDRPQVVERAKAYWQTAAPDLVASGHVHFSGFDFLATRPPLPTSAKPDVILLRIILHDWSDKYALKLLRSLRSIAGAETKLVVVDTIMGYACRGYNEEIKEKEEPPEPLLANLGATSVYAYDMDIAMMLNLNASERTLADFRALFAASGWGLREVHRHPGTNKMLYPAIVAVPV